VVKCLCPLISSEEQIDKAMSILDTAFGKVMGDQVANQAS
jgi:diaminobutyrate-2-oxoglutarate transaminase